MKQLFVSFCLSLCITTLSAQDISGTWAGLMYNENRFSNRYFFLEIKQKDRAVWGVFSTTDSTDNKNVTCVCNISGLATEKPSSQLELSRGRSFISDDHNYNKIYQYCEVVAQLNIRYLLEDSIEYMIGEWYDEPSPQTTRQKKGYIVLQHLSTGTERKLDNYFPTLHKLIAKGATDGKTVAIRPDDISLAKDKEKKLLGIWKGLLAKMRN